MRSDFDLIVHRFPDKQDLHIYFVADVHLGAKEHLAKEWNEFTGKVLQDPKAYLILGGDLINNGTRTSVSNIFDETIRPREQKKLIAETLKPLRDRILCALPGNHEGRSGKDVDDDPMYDILAKLDLEDYYRENLAFVKIQMGNTRSCGTKNPTYVLAVTHGTGGGIYTGASVNRNERFAYTIDGIDALLVGHSHKPLVTQPGKIVVDPRQNKARIVPVKMVVATSWLEYGGYAAKKMLLPSSHASQVITLSGNKKLITVSM